MKYICQLLIPQTSHQQSIKFFILQRYTAGFPLPGVTSIILTRATDSALIPYDSVHGITLITVLRLGLLAPLRTRAYHQFVALPLFQDMAPWNIVFLGGRLDYIDYDTRDKVGK